MNNTNTNHFFCKTNFFVFLFLSVSLNMSAQDWIELPTEDATWSTYFYWVGSFSEIFPFHTRQISVDGDSIIDGQRYTKLIANTDTVTFGNQVLEVDKYIGSIYQSERVVLILMDGESVPDTLYDFNIPVGTIVATGEEYNVQNCQPDLCPYIRLTSRDSIQLGDELWRERLNFELFLEDVSVGWPYSWIEGIGSTLGLLNNPIDNLEIVLSTNTPHSWRELLCAEVGDERLYTGEQFDGECDVIRGFLTAVEEVLALDVAVFPNPASDYITLEVGAEDGKQVRYQLVNMNGELVQQGDINVPSHTISIEGLSTGVYVLRVLTRDSSKTLRVLKH